MSHPPQGREIPVAVADSIENTLLRELQGNKQDTAIFAPDNVSSMMRYIKGLVATAGHLGGALSFIGYCDPAMAASPNTIVCPNLIGFTDGCFNSGYQMIILRNADVPGAAPEAERRDITNYVSVTGTLTTANFTANVEANDIVLVIHNSVAAIIQTGIALAIQVNGGAARDNLEQVLEDFFAVVGCDGANVFNPTIQGAPRTDLDTALAQLATYFVLAGAAMALQVNNNPARTNLQQALNDYFTVVGCDGANVFSTTIQGVARTTLEAAFDGLAAYFVAAGAALSVTIDPGGAARTTLATLWNDLGQMLAGGAGITTFPARVAPANTVSLAEVIRYIAELKPHFDTPTALTHTTVSAAPAEDTVFTTAAIGPGLLHAIFFLNNLVAGDDITFRVYQWDSVSAAYQLLSEQQFVGVQTNKVYTISGLYVDSVAHIQARTLRTSATNRSFGSRRSIYQQPVA